MCKSNLKIGWLLFLPFMLGSCSQNDEFDKEDVSGAKDRKLIELSVPEYLSIAYDSENNELSNEEATNILKEFVYSSVETRGTTAQLTFNVNKEYYLNTTNSRSSLKQPIKIVEFTIGNETRNGSTSVGFASVVADKRFPNVLAYSPNGNVAEIEEYGAGIMMKRAQNVAQNYISQVEHYQDSLRDRTVEKVCTILGVKNFSFEKVENSLVLEEDTKIEDLDNLIESRGSAVNPSGTPIATIGPLINERLQWIQGWPQNQFIKECSKEDLNYWPSINYGGKYPAGCTAVAAASILTYLKPTIYSNDLGRNVDWSTALSNPVIDWFTSATDSYVIEAAAILKEVSVNIGTTYNHEGGSASAEGVRSYFGKLGIAMDGKSALNYFTIRPSIGAYRPVLLTGACRSISRAEYTNGRHAWTMDGIKIVKRTVTSRIELAQYNNYGYCHFGWVFGGGNGWYLFDSDGGITFDYGGDKYDIDLAAYPNIRK